MAIDYTILYRTRLELDDLQDPSNHWPVLVSAFNASERVQTIFARANAAAKHWLIQPEYGYSPDQYPTDGEVFAPSSRNEADFLADYLANATANPLQQGACID